MQFIRDIYAAKKAAGKPVVSFEFFPPKTDEGDRTLLEKQIPALLAARPDFCSVTYGAGGSTRDKTLMIVDRIQRAARPDRARASHLRQPHPRGSPRAAGKNPRARTAKTSSPCAAIRPAAANFSPRPAALNFPRSW